MICTCALANGVKRYDEQKAGANASKAENKSKQKRYSKKITVRAKALTSVSMGKNLYKQYQCFDCHSIAGKGCKDGIGLDGIGSIRTKEFIREHIVDPDKHFDKHPEAFQVDLNLMPPQQLEPAEVASLVEYLFSLK